MRDSELTDDSLKQRLAAAAAELSPEFSADLHERIMSRLNKTPASRRLNWRFIVPTVAATLVITVSAVLFLVNARPPGFVPTGREIAIRPLPSVPDIRNPVHALDEPVVAQWASARYAYLDRDGEKVLNYFSRQLDVLP